MAQKILLTGATGYVGGTVLSTLLESEDSVVQNAKISALVRSEGQAQTLRAKGVDTIVLSDSNNGPAIAEIASNYDIVINGASGFELGLSMALIEGLAERKKKLGTEVHYIHTSGTTNLTDSPLLNLYPGYNPTPISDASPTDIPILIKQAIQSRHVWLIDDGSALKAYVHIRDAARLYEIIVGRVLCGLPVPYDEKGVLFVGSSEHSWHEVGERIARDGNKLNALESEEIKHLSMDEAARALRMENMQYVEAAYVSSARDSADVVKVLRWQPRYSDAFEPFFEEIWRAVLDGRR
ncbi:hypothetical protein BDV06DRAFT_212377 [Aspergillus oleicola]